MAWWETFFDATYRRLWAARTGEEQTRADVEGIERMLVAHGLEPPLRVLDLACGDGRIACGLARRGHDVAGVDLAADQLAAAQVRAEAGGVEVAWFRADVRQPPPQLAELDAVVLWFSSFGYFDETADDLRVLEAARRVLRPGGLLLLDTQHRDRVARAGLRRDWEQVGEETLLRELSFDPARGRVTERVTIVRPDAPPEERSFSVRVYTATELVALARAAGLVVEALYGGPAMEPFTVDSRLVLVARRPA